MPDLIQRRRSCRRGIGWRPQFGDQPQDLCKQHPRHGDLGHLEGDIAAVADDLRADLNQLLLQAGQRPVLDRLGLRQSAPRSNGPPGATRIMKNAIVAMISSVGTLIISRRKR